MDRPSSSPRRAKASKRAACVSGASPITADGRGKKVAHLAAHPAAELVFWMFNERLQFRLLGNVELVRQGAARDDMWRELNDSGRAMFLWPPPGEPRRADAVFPDKLATDKPAPPSFVLLVLRPWEVESLELNETPHRRRCWRKAKDWNVELLNP